VNNLLGISISIAYCLAKPQLALMERQPVDLPCLSALAHISAANTFTLLIKASATLTVYRGLYQTLFSCPGLSPCSSCAYPVSNISMHHYGCVALMHYMKPAFSRKVDSELRLLPPAAPYKTRSGHCWYFWARWSAVALEVFSRAPVGAQTVFG